MGGLWTHDFTVEVNPVQRYVHGTGVNGLGQSGPETFNEDVEGKFNSNGTVILTSNRAFNYVDS